VVATSRRTAARELCLDKNVVMHTLEARVPTPDPARYLKQLCNHAAAMGSGPHKGDLDVRSEWSETHGEISTGFARCVLTAEAGSLVLRVDADSADGADRLRTILTNDLTRFSHRAPLEIEWRELP
jgi:hypothetical protein